MPSQLLRNTRCEVSFRRASTWLKYKRQERRRRQALWSWIQMMTMTGNKVEDMSTNMRESQKKRWDNENVTTNLHLVYFFLEAFSPAFVTKKSQFNTGTKEWNHSTNFSRPSQLYQHVWWCRRQQFVSCRGRRNDQEEGTRCRTQHTGRKISLSSCKVNKFNYIPWACLG